MKTLLRILFAAPLLVMISCKSDIETIPLSDRLKSVDIELLLLEQTRNKSIPAIAIGIFDSDSIITYFEGVKGINNQIPIEINDKYNIGSCTKAFTSFLAAQLIKQGYIKYETTIREIFDTENSINPFYLDKTLADLLSHKAGIQPFTNEIEFNRIPPEFNNKNRDNSRQLFSEWVLTLNPVVDTLQSYIYSNAGYSIAATMLEKVSEKSWETLVAEEIFEALEINGWFDFPHRYSNNQPRGHINLSEYNSSADNKLIQFPDSSNYNIYLLEPGGAITLSIREHSVFLQELLRGLLGRGTLLNNKEYKDLLTSKNTYINGWLQLKSDNIYYLAHEGSNGTFYARAILCKELNYGIEILSNSANKETINGIQKITNIIDSLLRKVS